MFRRMTCAPWLCALGMVLVGSCDSDEKQGSYTNYSTNQPTTCTNSLDCPGDLVCDPGLSICVECAQASDCSANQSCAGGVCRSPCSSDRDCKAQGLLCDVSAGHCVECSKSDECQAGFTCQQGACRVASSEAPGGQGNPEASGGSPGQNGNGDDQADRRHDTCARLGPVGWPALFAAGQTCHG